MRSRYATKVLAGEGKVLTIMGDAGLLLDLELEIIDRIRWLDVEEGDGLPGGSLDKQLHFVIRDNVMRGGERK